MLLTLSVHQCVRIRKRARIRVVVSSVRSTRVVNDDFFSARRDLKLRAPTHCPVKPTGYGVNPRPHQAQIRVRAAASVKNRSESVTVRAVIKA